MSFLILDESFLAVHLLDDFIESIWTDRYRTYGDFEITVPIGSKSIPYIKKNAYLCNPESEHLMVIESIVTNFDAETGSVLTFSGRSLESILDRRIIWGLKTYNSSLQNVIKQILNDCFINPSDSRRKVNKMVFKETSDYRITNNQLRTQFTGDNVYDIIATLSEAYDFGFKIILNSNDKLEFSLYKGEDRSQDQTDNPYVIFSPSYDNLVNANYCESNLGLKNVTLIGGQGEGKNRVYETIEDYSSGLDRRELFTDARDLSTNVDGGTLSDTEYHALLNQRGAEKLAESKAQKSFAGEAELSSMFIYGVDYFLGDTVQVEDEYDHNSAALVSEIIYSENEEGKRVYPSFTLLDELDDDSRKYTVNGYLEDSDGNTIYDSSGDPIRTRSIYINRATRKYKVLEPLADSNNFNIQDSDNNDIESVVVYVEDVDI